MKCPQNRAVVRGLALVLAIVSLSTIAARANVYATNIKLNGTNTNANLGSGGSVNISYILNEPASAGVTIKILSGSAVVRSIAAAGGNPGTALGTNIVTWDGKNGAGANVPGGTYSVSITAASTGYTNWTKITQDTNAGNVIFQCRGLDVNKHTNSPYYGRIFVGNASIGPNVGDLAGIYKLNADASPADEGSFADGGYSWAGDGFSPWRIRVGPEDKLYVEHWSGNGILFSWDQQMSTNSMQSVMRDDNNPNPAPGPPAGPINYQGLVVAGSTSAGNLGSFFIGGNSTGTNNRVYMTDNNTGGWGVMYWDAQADGTLAPNLAPNIAVRATASHFGFTNSDLDDSAFDMDIDKNGNIYVAQQPYDSTSYKLFRFPAYAGVPLTNATWKAGISTNANDITAIAVNPAATLLAVALSLSTAGNNALLVVDANNGSNVVARLGMDNHKQFAVAWDNVGNLYAAYDDPAGGDGFWRAFSPPGTNQATTVALEQIISTVPTPPHITGITLNVSGGTVTIDFSGSANDDASAFTLQRSTQAEGAYTDVVATPSQISPGVFRVSTTLNGAIGFYRIKR
jgi:hypothetical protein